MYNVITKPLYVLTDGELYWSENTNNSSGGKGWWTRLSQASLYCKPSKAIVLTPGWQWETLEQAIALLEDKPY